MDRRFKIALCQMLVGAGKEANLENAARLVGEAARSGAKFVCLPEMWNCPYDVREFASYAEPEDGPSVSLLRDLACENGIFLIGGSLPEDGGGAMYNTAFAFGPDGRLLAKHRKVHLFDVDIEGGVRFKESNFFQPGEGSTLFDTAFGKVGLAICFDVRFPEMFRDMAAAGARLIFLPAAFNMTTGPAHWDLLMRGRALDNQLYLAACSPARNLSSSYLSYGHSCIATPWGEYCGAADARETIVYGEIDWGYLEKVRAEIPLDGGAPTQRRKEGG